jgi:hypothetical protein
MARVPAVESRRRSVVARSDGGEIASEKRTKSRRKEKWGGWNRIGGEQREEWFIHSSATGKALCSNLV